MMQLITTRLTLQELIQSNLEAIHNLNSIPEVDQYNTLGLPENIGVTEKLIEGWLSEQEAVPRLSYIFSIINNDTNDFIGMMGLRLGKPRYRIGEVWYKFLPEVWGRGYATEALMRLLSFGFTDLNLHRIEAGCAVENVGSVKVLEKAGMLREGRKRKILPIRGEWVDNFEYAILEEDFNIQHEQ